MATEREKELKIRRKRRRERLKVRAKDVAKARAASASARIPKKVVAPVIPAPPKAGAKRHVAPKAATSKPAATPADRPVE